MLVSVLLLILFLFFWGALRTEFFFEQRFGIIEVRFIVRLLIMMGWGIGLGIGRWGLGRCRIWIRRVSRGLRRWLDCRC